jgi:hypothetical protein
MSFVHKLFESEALLAMKFYCTLANQLAESLIFAGTGKVTENSIIIVDVSMKEVVIFFSQVLTFSGW